MNKNKKLGFTLIELLVVVAIIGILASLVIASLNQARSRGVDAAIKGTMSSLRAQMEIYYDDNNNYGVGQTTACGSPIVTPLLNDVQAKNGGTAVNCVSSGQTWVAQTPLVTNSGEFFCVDHTGAAKTGTTALGQNPTQCP